MDWLAAPDRLLGLTYERVADCATSAGHEPPCVEADDMGGYASLRRGGVGLAFDGRSVNAIHLFSEGHQGFEGFQHPLPSGVRFNMSRIQARVLLGAPVKSSGASVVGALGLMPSWDLFAGHGHYIHLEYTFDGQGVRLVTLSAEVA